MSDASTKPGQVASVVEGQHGSSSSEPRMLAPSPQGPAVGPTRSRQTWQRLRGVRPFDALSAAVGLGFAGLASYLLLRMITRLFWDGGLTLAPLQEVSRLPGLGVLLSHTFIVVGVSGVVALLVSALLAWLNERTDARMGAFSDALPIIPLLLPSIAVAIGWILLLSPRSGYLNWGIRELAGLAGIGIEEGPFQIHSWYGLIMVYTFQMVPVAFLAISAGLRNLDASLEEQARVCGAPPAKVFSSVTIRAVLPSVGAAMFLVVWVGFATFSVPAVIAGPAGIEILSVRIARLVNFEFPARLDLAVGLGGIMIPVLGVIWYYQRRLVRRGRHSSIGGKGAKARRLELGPWRPVARGFFILYGIATVVLPIGALALVTLNGFWSTQIDWGALSLDGFRAMLADGATSSAMRNSVILAASVASVAVFVAGLVGLWSARSRSAVSDTVDVAMKLPAAFSGLILALGALVAFGGPPFELGSTIWILFLAYIVIVMPLATVVIDASVSQIGRELSEASAVSGAGGGRTFVRIQLPLLAPGLLAAWALLFVRVVGDVEAASILAGTRNNVVGFRILEVYTFGSYGVMAGLGIFITAITVFVLVLVLIVTKLLTRSTRVPRTSGLAGQGMGNA